MKFKFVPTIVELVYSQFDLKDATLKIGDKDADNIIQVKLGEGNLTFTERQNVEYTLDGGNLDEVRLGDQVPVEVRLDAVWDFYTGPGSQSTITGSLTNPTIADAIKGTDGASTWTSTDDDACRPYCVDIYLSYNADCAAGVESMILADFRWEQLDFDASAGTISVSGRCNITTIASTRS